MNYVIRNSDGDTIIDELTDEQLDERLKTEYYGKSAGMSRMPRVSDTNYWDDSILIIRGEVITGERNNGA